MASMRDQPGNGPADAADGQLPVTEFVGELGALISELESAKEGSQSLDLRIHHGFRVAGGHGKDIASLLIKEGVSWPTVEATLNEIVPPYSTSLDAALPGEEIVFSIRSVKGQQWGAMQRTSSGGEVLAWAATEPLARRLAALMYWQAELKKSLEDEEIMATRTATSGSEHVAADGSGAHEPAANTDELPLAGPDGNQESLQEDWRHPWPDGTEQPDQSDQVDKDWKILF